MTSPYDNPFFEDNVYGHALALITRNRSTDRPADERVVHLDVGCGFGRIAEPLVAATGRHYVGVDAEEEGLASLRGRGFETHQLWLGTEDETFEALKRIVGDRPLGSISMLDTLEHLPTGDAVLAALRRIAAPHVAIVVISVPNIAHRDVGLRLAFGQWNYTDVGLLDHTHTRFFTATALDAVLRHAGLHPVDTNDVIQAVSDQHFPEDHPALVRGSLLSQMLQQLREQVDPLGEVNQLVRACVPGPAMANETFVKERNPERPFLSVVTRTQGKRLHGLQETFTSLTGQTCTDFEVLIVGHRLDLASQRAVERVIEDNPEWLRTRTRLIRVETGNRTRPLNEGFAAATGHYIAILDDDDLPMAHWVETFKALAAANPGRLLRAVAVRQDVENVTIQQSNGMRAVGPLERTYPSRFDFLDHLRVNRSPPVSIAFPRGVFHDLKLEFDESLTTTEDWDYIMRVAGITGVAATPAITSIYRWWLKDESSRTDHSQEEWDFNCRQIFQKMDRNLVLLPQGSTAQLRRVLDERDQLEVEVHALRSKLAELDANIDRIHSSTSWRYTAPFRRLTSEIKSRRLPGGSE